jgi:hypothetical protein
VFIGGLRRFGVQLVLIAFENLAREGEVTHSESFRSTLIMDDGKAKEVCCNISAFICVHLRLLEA